MILINSSENLEDHKESQERVRDVAGESTNTLLMRKQVYRREMLQVIVTTRGRAGTEEPCLFCYTSVRTSTIRLRTVPLNEGCGMVGGAN